MDYTLLVSLHTIWDAKHLRIAAKTVVVAQTYHDATSRSRGPFSSLHVRSHVCVHIHMIVYPRVRIHSALFVHSISVGCLFVILARNKCHHHHAGFVHVERPSMKMRHSIHKRQISVQTTMPYECSNENEQIHNAVSQSPPSVSQTSALKPREESSITRHHRL